jgi:hypothetical protein
MSEDMNPPESEQERIYAANTARMFQYFPCARCATGQESKCTDRRKT